MKNHIVISRNNENLDSFDPAPGQKFIIGSGEGANIVLKDKGIQPEHAELEYSANTWWISPCHSDNGNNIVTVNGREIIKEAVIGRIEAELGNVELTFETDFISRGENKDFEDFKEKIYLQVVKELNAGDASQEHISDMDLEQKALKLVNKLISSDKKASSQFSQNLLNTAQLEIIQDLLQLGPLEPLLADDDVTEIMVIDYKRIYMEKNGKIQLSDRFFKSPEHLLTVIERIVSPIGRRIDESSPLVDARLADGSRVNAVIPPIVPDGSCLTIRKFGKNVFSVDRLIGYESITPNMAAFIEKCVEGRKNIVVSGGTGSGKTSLLNAISLFIGNMERIVTIEDSLELKLQQDHVVRMEARPPNAEGRGEVTIRRLVKNSLRMRPDRIVIGECRGGEALDMLQAMNTGHDGSLTTVHANSPKDTISRLETLVLMAGMDLPLSAIQQQICSAVDLIVQTTRLSDGTRKVVSITEVVGLENGEPILNEVFTFKREGIDAKNDHKVLGRFMAVSKPTFMEEFKNNGIPLKDEWFSNE